MAYTRLGDLLLSINLITEEQLQQALINQKKTKNRLGKELIEEGVITESQLIQALVRQLGVEFIDLSKERISAEMTQVIPKSIAKKYNLVPIRLNKNTLYIAIHDPLNFMAIEEVRAVTRKRVVPMIATEEAIEHTLTTLYGNEGAVRAIEEMKREMAERQEISTHFDNFITNDITDNEQSAPTVRLVNSLIERAVAEGAGDIHLEPREQDLRVRMRIDGILQNIMTVPKNLQASVISRLKIMGGMDIAERKIPQDGRSHVKIKNADINLRISTLPTIYGEKLVMRLLDRNSQLLDKDKIGLSGEDLKKYMYLTGRKSGVILIAGPTGSGKSSTMYSMIRELNKESVNLITLEDPVEYNIAGVNQVQINEKIGMTFANGLRSILRQDPDIISVGEIRDSETAKIVMRAAITGHLVLSTIHTNDAFSTIDRLLDIGIEPYLISSALNGVISQRLVRRICPNCREEYIPTKEELSSLGLTSYEDGKFYHGKGCASCFGTGYRGRTAVFEILLISQRLKNEISEGLKSEELKSVVEKEGHFISLEENCRRLILDGVTTIEEARRVINSAEYNYEG